MPNKDFLGITLMLLGKYLNFSVRYLARISLFYDYTFGLEIC
jgi:hypothetical protein